MEKGREGAGCGRDSTARSSPGKRHRSATQAAAQRCTAQRGQRTCPVAASMILTYDSKEVLL